jgi:membrane-associated protease RseP (regulator of RpoE activity)
MSDNGRQRVTIELPPSSDYRLPQYEFLDLDAPSSAEAFSSEFRARPRRKNLLLALGLFFLTVISTLAVGAQLAIAYANNEPAFAHDFNPLAPLQHAWANPRILLLGIPFSFTLLGILLAHELGHYFACRYYGIDASYPYFVPAPTLIGTMGAFIRIHSPILNRRALFDVGIAGPAVGFALAVPALIVGILHSKVIPGANDNAVIVFGNPLVVKLVVLVFRPNVPLGWLLLNPVSRAAWVGFFATALNLLPAGQLDGGHIVYSVIPEKHSRVSIGVILALLPLGLLWSGWLMWAALLMLLGFRHPRLMNRWEPLDSRRRAWALAALVMFALCFTPMPFTTH